ncbi:hypothetical protein O6H91_Y109900 [Diphasiastrum complanatum]|nr:hypothetical protein O6H91_Y109900 [Diphasiastrum complanatum]
MNALLLIPVWVQCCHSWKVLSGESMALLWTIKERQAQESKFATYFVSLPASFNTGLSFTMEGLKELEGALVFEEILQAKEHLRRQYDALFPALIEAFPETFPEQVYTWENFLWASELWYSNGVKVGFPDGTFKACLIPVAGILNHSVYPHITHYSRIDAATSTLKLHAIRPCKCGEQCFLSYGALSSADLLMFYGFVLRDDNPYDTIPIELDVPEPSSSSQKSELLSRYSITSSHMLRATWLCKSASTKNSLPSRLLAALRIIFMEESELEIFDENPRYRMISPANEKAVFEALLAIVDPLLGPFQNLDGHDGIAGDVDSCTNEDWDVRLAIHFKDQQRRILSSLQRSCIKSLHE